MKKNINETINAVIDLYTKEAINFNIDKNGMPNWAYFSGLLEGLVKALPDTKENRNFLEAVAYRTTFTK